MSLVLFDEVAVRIVTVALYGNHLQVLPLPGLDHARVLGPHPVQILAVDSFIQPQHVGPGYRTRFFVPGVAGSVVDLRQEVAGAEDGLEEIAFVYVDQLLR